MSAILKGMFLHTFNEAGELCKQGYVVKANKTECAVQLFSWMTGDSTEIEMMPVSVLHGPTVKLYATQNDWRRAAFEAQQAAGLTASGKTWEDMETLYGILERAS